MARWAAQAACYPNSWRSSTPGGSASWTSPRRSDRETPVIDLPPIFAPSPGLTLTEISRYDERAGVVLEHLPLGEHTGTHFDAPIHWITGKDLPENASDTIPARRFVGPACVIDVTAEVEPNPDFLLTPERVQAWEAEHGRIPAGAWVLLRTGWSKRTSREDFLNVRDDGAHSPGFSKECSEFLAHERDVLGVGVETIGTDAGQAGTFDPPFPNHSTMHGAGKFGLASLSNLDQLPRNRRGGHRGAAQDRGWLGQPAARHCTRARLIASASAGWNWAVDVERVCSAVPENAGRKQSRPSARRAAAPSIRARSRTRELSYGRAAARSARGHRPIIRHEPNSVRRRSTGVGSSTPGPSMRPEGKRRYPPPISRPVKLAPPIDPREVVRTELQFAATQQAAASFCRVTALVICTTATILWYMMLSPTKICCKKIG